MNFRVFACLAFLVMIMTPGFGQDEWADKFVKGLGESGAKKKAALDSVDFQFALSVNENSSVVDIENKGEGGARMLYAMRDRKDKTVSEIARDSLEFSLSLYNARWYKLAQQSFLGAQNFMEQNSLTKEVSYVRCVSTLGLVYLSQGSTLDAEKYISYSLENSEQLLGQGSAGYAANLNSQAKLYQLTGKYNEAEKLFDEAGQIVDKKFGGNSMQSAIVINNKAMLYQALGRYPEAIDLMKKASAKAEAAPKKLGEGKKSFTNRIFLTNLAYTYQLSGNLAEAEKQFLYIKDVYEKRLLVGQKNNPEYANLLNQLALLYIQMGKNDQVEPLLQKSAQVYVKKFTENNPSFAKVQNDLGNFYRMQGRFAEGETALQKALSIRKNTLGENHPDYVKTLDNLAVLYWKNNDLTKAYTYFNDALSKSLDFINQYFPPMSEAEKTKYWDILQPRFQRFYDFAIQASATQPSILGDVFDYQIATKALLLNSTNKIKRAILTSGDQSLINDYLSWISQKETLARYYSLSKEELQQQKIDVAGLEKQANAMERSLSQRSGDFSKGYSSGKISFKQVSALLGDTEALVEVIRVRTYDKDFTDQSRYLVLTLTKGSAQPVMVVLENGNQLETRYAKYYKNAVLQRIPDQFSYEQFWSKIDPLVAGKKVLYLSPDGVYNQININTLKKPDGDFLENRFDVVTIGNAKDLIALKSKKAIAKKDAFLLGFPDFGGAAVALPGTKVEMEGVSKILKASGYAVTQREQKVATEANIKAVKAPALMHIATHGYFLADTDLGGGSAMGIDAENAKNNPLLRSGLILAGAPDPNKAEQSADLQSNDNGILTAYEAMNLNLEGTDLIVLSACETGLGDVKAGEGVYGLQRAFLVAGANALIMSLWKVDDEATQMLMTNFYTNWTKSGNKLKAFKQAQLQLMTKYKDPYYWGAFVMMGM
ncbi:MAG: CHAT domain-containing protein [Cyclobacteriaceae bacterium]|nr:CHAT domain-containing protein [Cyclobacteriaceae bacterium]